MNRQQRSREQSLLQILWPHSALLLGGFPVSCNSMLRESILLGKDCLLLPPGAHAWNFEHLAVQILTCNF